MKLKTFETTHRFNRTGNILVYGGLLIFIVIFNMESNVSMWEQLPLLSRSQISDHLSNFALSTMFMLGVGMSLLSYTKYTWRFIVSCAVFMIVLNFVTELFITVENTKDIVDAWAGTAGVIVGLAILLIVQRRGIKKSAHKN